MAIITLDKTAIWFKVLGLVVTGAFVVAQAFGWITSGVGEIVVSTLVAIGLWALPSPVVRTVPPQ